MLKVKANANSKLKNVNIQELGRIDEDGEVFNIENNRKESLVDGKNFFKVSFAEIVGESIEPQPKDENEKDKEEPVKKEKPVRKAKKASKK